MGTVGSPGYNNAVPQTTRTTSSENATSPSKSKFNFESMVDAQESVINQAFANLEPLSETKSVGELQPIENSYSIEMSDSKLLEKADNLGRDALSNLSSPTTVRIPFSSKIQLDHEKTSISDGPMRSIKAKDLFKNTMACEKVAVNKLGIMVEDIRMAEIKKNASSSENQREYKFAIFIGKSEDGTTQLILEDSHGLAKRDNLSGFAGWMNTKKEDIAWTEGFKNNQGDIGDKIVFIGGENNREENRNISADFVSYTQRYCDDEDLLSAVSYRKEQCTEYYKENPYKPSESKKNIENEKEEPKKVTNRDNLNARRFEKKDDEKQYDATNKEKEIDQKGKMSQVEKSVAEQKDIELSEKKERDKKIAKEMNDKADKKRNDDIKYYEH